MRIGEPEIPMVKAIETIHNGCRFRSRLEARWSIFFETLGIDYQYELQGYDFDGIYYLPDFWLPVHQCWIEIKGPEPTGDELRKAHLLSLHTGKPIFIFFGDAWLPSQQKHGGAYRCSKTKWKQGYYWYECPNCKRVGLAATDEGGHFSCQCTPTIARYSGYNDNSHRLHIAYSAARQARFEHGEQGTQSLKPESQNRLTTQKLMFLCFLAMPKSINSLFKTKAMRHTSGASTV